MPKVTMIPATINPMTHLSSMATRKRRVAGYDRVSTDSDKQFTSYEAQVDYYTRFIQSKPEGEFVRVYTDESISGTNTKHRECFKEMDFRCSCGENRLDRDQEHDPICQKYGRQLGDHMKAKGEWSGVLFRKGRHLHI